MHSYFIFLIKSLATSGVLFGYYSAFLRNKKFHQYNRFYLLGTLIISIALPLLNFRLFSFQQNVISNPTHFFQRPVSITSNQLDTSLEGSIVFWMATIAITAAMILMLLKKIVWIYQLKHRSPIIKMDGFDLMETDVKQAPFSFLNNLFWRTNISVDGDIGKKIFAHELTHIRDKHTCDKLFSQLLLCFFWVNPFYWLIQKELNAIHEFIADSKSIEQGDTQSFAEMLLLSHNDGRFLSPSHSFFNSSIKRRITMITTSKSARHSYARRVFALPILLVVTIALSFKVVNAQTDPKLHPNEPVKIDKVSIIKRNDSVADVSINYRDANGNPQILNVTAGYSKSDSAKNAVIYDEESGEKREVSPAETREIVNQIIQNPPTEDMYIVDDREYSPQDIKKLDAKKIKTINVYTGEDAVKRFGDKAKNGVIVFTTK